MGSEAARLRVPDLSAGAGVGRKALQIYTERYLRCLALDLDCGDPRSFSAFLV